MTRDEFVQRRRALVRETPRFDALAAVALTGLAMLGIPIARSTPDWVAYAYVGFLLVLSVAYLAYSARWARQTGLLCHTCGRPMLGRAADAALATGTCPHCRKPAFGQQV